VEKVGYGLVNEIVWVKRNVLANKGWRGYQSYTPTTERILFFAMTENERKQRIDKARRYFSPDSNFTDVWISNMTVSTDEQVHPTQKPLWLLRRIIKTSCPPSGVVLDPFMGSGTTGVACEVLNRTFIGFEMDKTYFEIAEKRIREQKSVGKLFNFDSMLEGT
jgi:site-specific DNA-methyltransferase (adenine-specific)